MSEEKNDNKNGNLTAPRTLLMQSLGWIGGLGVLSSGMVWAQPQTSPHPSWTAEPAAAEPEPVVYETQPAQVPAAAVRATSSWEPEVNWASEPSWTPAPVATTEPEAEIMLAPATAQAEPKPVVSTAPAPGSSWEVEVNWASEPSWTPAAVASEPQPEPVETAAAVEANSPDTAYGIGGSNSNHLYNPPTQVVLSPRNPAPVAYQAPAPVAYQAPAPAPARSWSSYQPPVSRRTSAPIRAWRPQPYRSLPQPPSYQARRGINSVNLGPVSYSPSEIKYGDATPIGRSYYQYIAPNLRPDNGNNSIIFPLSIPSPITSLFGWRTHPISGTQQFHHGTDIGAPMGTPVLAALAGKVAIGDALKGYGLSVVLEHARSEKATQQTLYAHLSEIFVQPGEEVKQGSIIGSVGSSGYSTGPHLHFELRELTSEGWVTLDPGAQLEYALAQIVKTWETAAVAPEENKSPGEKALKKLKKLGFQEIAPEDMPIVKVRKDS